MADLLKDLIDVLKNDFLVQEEGVDAFADFMPDSPDEVVALYEYGGPPTTTGVEAVDRNVQVSVRGPKGDPDTPRKKSWEIFNLLDTPLDRVLDTREHIFPGTRWAVITARQTPTKIREDSQGRSVYVFNLVVTTSRD